MTSLNQMIQQQQTTATASAAELTDKETNTECVFLQPSAVASPSRRVSVGPPAVASNPEMAVSGLVKRSMTFSPSAPINKNDYICKVD